MTALPVRGSVFQFVKDYGVTEKGASATQSTGQTLTQLCDLYLICSVFLVFVYTVIKSHLLANLILFISMHLIGNVTVIAN